MRIAGHVDVEAARRHTFSRSLTERHVAQLARTLRMIRAEFSILSEMVQPNATGLSPIVTAEGSALFVLGAGGSELLRLETMIRKDCPDLVCAVFRSIPVKPSQHGVCQPIDAEALVLVYGQCKNKGLCQGVVGG
jgi:hypothetical protein